MTSAKKSEAIYFETGTRTILNTEWPIENKVEKRGSRWMVTFGICNGTAKGSQFYKTKTEAISAANGDEFFRTDNGE